VRRRYDVLLERYTQSKSTGGFQNIVAGR
jgi:hypothetical protein